MSVVITASLDPGKVNTGLRSIEEHSKKTAAALDKMGKSGRISAGELDNLGAKGSALKDFFSIKMSPETMMKMVGAVGALTTIYKTFGKDLATVRRETIDSESSFEQMALATEGWTRALGGANNALHQFLKTRREAAELEKEEIERSGKLRINQERSGDRGAILVDEKLKQVEVTKEMAAQAKFVKEEVNDRTKVQSLIRQAKDDLRIIKKVVGETGQDDENRVKQVEKLISQLGALHGREQELLNIEKERAKLSGESDQTRTKTAEELFAQEQKFVELKKSVGIPAIQLSMKMEMDRLKTTEEVEARQKENLETANFLKEKGLLTDQKMLDIQMKNQALLERRKVIEDQWLKQLEDEEEAHRIINGVIKDRVDKLYDALKAPGQAAPAAAGGGPAAPAAAGGVNPFRNFLGGMPANMGFNMGLGQAGAFNLGGIRLGGRGQGLGGGGKTRHDIQEERDEIEKQRKQLIAGKRRGIDQQFAPGKERNQALARLKKDVKGGAFDAEAGANAQQAANKKLLENMERDGQFSKEQVDLAKKLVEKATKDEKEKASMQAEIQNMKKILDAMMKGGKAGQGARGLGPG